MIAAWGSDSDEDKIYETDFMALGDSDLDEEDDGSKVSILELKEKCYCFENQNLFPR